MRKKRKSIEEDEEEEAADDERSSYLIDVMADLSVSPVADGAWTACEDTVICAVAIDSLEAGA